MHLAPRLLIYAEYSSAGPLNYFLTRKLGLFRVRYLHK